MILSGAFGISPTFGLSNCDGPIHVLINGGQSVLFLSVPVGSHARTDVCLYFALLFLSLWSPSLEARDR